MKVIILGGHGFLGKHVTALLQVSEHHVVPLSRKDGFDLLDFSLVKDKLNELQPDVIFNCAAHVGSLHYVSDHAAEVVDDNIQMALNLYRSVHEVCNNAKIINPLSNCSYPGEANLHSETDWWQGEVHESVFAYANAKRFIYVISKCYKKQYGLVSVNFLVPNTFGPGDYTDPNKTHALNGMIIRMLKAQKEGAEEFEIWGSGKPVREWGYVKDIVNILLKGITIKEDLTYPVNIAQNKGYSIKESAELIKEALYFKGKLAFNTKYQDGASKKILDNRKFKQLFPDFKFTDHKEGILETVKYYETALK